MSASTTFSLATEEDVERIVSGIIDSYKGSVDKYPMVSGMADRVFMLHLMESSLYIDDILVLNGAVNKIINTLHHLMPGGVLTVGELRERIKNLHERTPVMIDKVASGWNSHPVHWESIKLSDEDARNLPEGESALGRVWTDENGEKFLAYDIDAVFAFGSCQTNDAQGRKLFLIHANY